MRVSIIGLLQAAAVVTAVFSLLTLLPVDHSSIQLFTHFRLQYLGVSLLLLVFFLWMRSPWFAGMLLVAATASAALVLPAYFNKPQVGDGISLTLLHANVLSSNSEFSRLTTLVTEIQPDIIVLQEISLAWESELRHLRTAYPHGLVEARNGNFGIALLSRLPLRSVSHFDSAPLGYPTIIASVEVGDDVLNVIATHPMIPVNSSFYAARNEQMADIAGLLGNLPGPKMLVGDLNLSQWDINYPGLEEQAGVRSARQGFGIIPTWPTFMPFAMIPIDHVLVSDSISIKNIYSGPRIGSDHLPLIVTMKL